MTIVCDRSRTACAMNPRISAPARESRLPVGSSAKTICGRVASARATATRCCCPPDSSEGRCDRRSRRPTVSITPSSHSRFGFLPASAVGSVMFSSAVSVGIRLYDWNTKPMRSRRRSVSSLSDSEPSATSPTKTSPDVRSSSPAAQCMSVDLPEPDGPMIAVNRPAANSTVTSSMARTAVSPEPYTLVACSARATAARGGASVFVIWDLLGRVVTIVATRARGVVAPTKVSRLRRTAQWAPPPYRARGRCLSPPSRGGRGRTRRRTRRAERGRGRSA